MDFDTGYKYQLAQLLCFKSGIEGGLTVAKIVARLANSKSVHPTVAKVWELLNNEINDQSTPDTTLAEKLEKTGLFDPCVVMIVGMEGSNKISVISAAIEYVKSQIAISES